MLVWAFFLQYYYYCYLYLGHLVVIQTCIKFRPFSVCYCNKCLSFKPNWYLSISFCSASHCMFWKYLQEFNCEICGNSSYWGRRAFERHFKEWRHQHGMRCLGIPNTKNFHEITTIKVFFLLFVSGYLERVCTFLGISA